MKHKSTGKQITAVETTIDKITGRGGISFILRYLEKIKIINFGSFVFKLKDVDSTVHSADEFSVKSISHHDSHTPFV